MQIKCKQCGKLIEQKMGRTLCIKCTNKRNKEIQAEYRKLKV